MNAPYTVNTDGEVMQGDRSVCNCADINDAMKISRALNKTTMPESHPENPNVHPAGFSLGEWQTDPDMPTMVLEAPYSQAKEIIAQTSSVGNARLICASPKLYRICEKILGYNPPSGSPLASEIIQVLDEVKGVPPPPFIFPSAPWYRHCGFTVTYEASLYGVERGHWRIRCDYCHKWDCRSRSVNILEEKSVEHRKTCTNLNPARSISICGACGQDITGTDHRGNCPVLNGGQPRYDGVGPPRTWAGHSTLKTTWEKAGFPLDPTPPEVQFTNITPPSDSTKSEELFSIAKDVIMMGLNHRQLDGDGQLEYLCSLQVFVSDMADKVAKS